MKRVTLAISLLALSLVSCSFASRLLGIEQDSSLEIVQHDKPDLPVNTQPFTEAGCSGDNLYVMECTADSPLYALGCDFLSVNALMGGLNPPYAVAACMHRWEGGEPSVPELFEQTGCLLPLYRSTVVFVDGKFQLVKSPEDFQALFAPIESEAEALAFALLLTGLNARYGWDNWELKEDSPYHFRVDRLEDTHVVDVEDGYLVNLYSAAEPPCGCGNHTVYQHDVLVRTDGQVEIVKSTPVYDFEACID